MSNDHTERDEDYQTEFQQIIETIKGYFTVIGSIVVFVLFLILVFIPALSKM